MKHLALFLSALGGSLFTMSAVADTPTKSEVHYSPFGGCSCRADTAAERHPHHGRWLADKFGVVKYSGKRH